MFSTCRWYKFKPRAHSMTSTGCRFSQNLFHHSKPKSSPAYFLVIPFANALFPFNTYTLTLEVPGFDRSLSSTSVPDTGPVPRIAVKTQEHQNPSTPSAPLASTPVSHCGLLPPPSLLAPRDFLTLLLVMLSKPL